MSRAATPRATVIAATGAALAFGAAGAAADDPAPSGPRLAGTYLIAGRITDAVNVPGERRGQTILRTWAFTPTCPAGSCLTVTLARQRVGGFDTVLLRRIASTRYQGSGRFAAPVVCGGRSYPQGELVPFTITVQMTAAIATAAGPVATRVNASYVSKRRTNLTPCVALPAHDAASYHGHLAAPAS